MLWNIQKVRISAGDGFRGNAEETKPFFFIVAPVSESNSFHLHRTLEQINDNEAVNVVFCQLGMDCWHYSSNTPPRDILFLRFEKTETYI